MSEKLISIIVPVYNAEKTIERCVNSLCKMMREVEIVCVDDGSKDNSGEILDRISEDILNVIVIHQQNKGAAAARNRGLSVASGQYIMFCDADDEYHKDAISYIIEDIRNDKPDYIVFCREQYLLNGGLLRHAIGNSKHTIDCSWDEYFNNVLQEHGHCVSVFNKVYRNDIIKKYDLDFDEELHFGEDLWFNLNYIPNAQNLIEDFRAIYIQHSTEGSLCTSRNDDFYNLNMRCVLKYRSQFPERANMIDEYLNKYTFFSGVIALKRNLRIKNEYARDCRKQLFHPILDDDNFHKSLLYVSSMQTVKNTERMKKEAKWLLKTGLFGYSIRYYYYPKVKQFIRNTLLNNFIGNII